MALVDSIPDRSYIETVTSHLSDIWRETHANWEVYDEYINRENALWKAEEDRPTYHPGRAAATIQHAVDNQLAFEPRIHRFPTGSEEKDKRNADKVEPFVHAVFQEAALLEPQLTWKGIGRHLLTYGYGVAEGPILDSTERPAKLKRRKGEDDEDWEHRMTIWQNASKMWQPFRVRAPHPAHVLLEPFKKRPDDGVKIVQRYAIEIHRLVEARKSKSGKAKKRNSFVVDFDYGNEPYRIVNTVEYWSLDWHALMADSKLLFVEPNTWGFLPFKHAFAGFGQLRTKDNAISLRHLAVGLLEPIMESLKVQAQAFSGLHNNLVEASFPDENVTGDADSIRNQKAQGEQIIELRPGETRDFMSPPDITRWMFEAEKLVDFDIEFGTFARNLAGLRQVGTFTVGQTAIQMQAAERKFIAPSLQLEHMATLVGQDILRLIDLIDEPLTVRGFTIRPSDIQHDYSLEVKFEIADPAIEMQRRAIAMQEVAAGLKSKETYWEETRREDVTTERMRLLEDQMRAHPAVQQAFIEEMAKALGLMPLLEKVRDQRAAGEEPEVGLEGLIGPEGGGGPGGAPTALTGSQTQPSRVGQEFAASPGAIPGEGPVG